MVKKRELLARIEQLEARVKAVEELRPKHTINLVENDKVSEGTMWVVPQCKHVFPASSAGAGPCIICGMQLNLSFNT